MSLKTEPIHPVAEEAIRVAGAAFPKGNSYLSLRDKLGPIFDDENSSITTCVFQHSPGYEPEKLSSKLGGMLREISR